MRILVHDYSGHPFQVQLSRALAGRGHDVVHVHCRSYTGGKGALRRRPDDPANFEVVGLDLGRPFDRYSPTRRLRQELAYGRTFTRFARSWRPEVVLSSNDPLFAKALSARWCAASATPWVFWLQDVYSVAMANHVRSRLGTAGAVVGRGFEAVERRLARHAAGVVAITSDFSGVLDGWGVDPAAVDVVENWAPLDELDQWPRDNPWAAEHGLGASRVALYAGTLGLKHDPSMLADLARRLEPSGDRVVVVSEGAGARWLRQRGAGQPNLVVLDYQPYEHLGQVLASADLLLAVLDPAAGEFSVPSKVLTYLCSGRAVLASVPAANLAARTIEAANAGVVVDPTDRAGFLDAAERLLAHDEVRNHHGRCARAYAEKAFDITAIADRFEDVLERALRR